MVGVVLLEVAVFLMLSHRRVNGIMLDVSVCGDQAPQLTPKLPYFLGGAPQPEQVGPGMNKNDGACDRKGVAVSFNRIS